MDTTDQVVLTAAGFRLGAIMPGAWKMLHLALLEWERSQQDKAGAK